MINGLKNDSTLSTNGTCIPFPLLLLNITQHSNITSLQCGQSSGFNFTSLDPAFLNFLREIKSNLLPEPLPSNLVVTFIVLYSLIISFAVVGNIVVVIVIGRHRLRRSVTDLYIFSLAVSDILIATLNMPFQLSYVIASEWFAAGAAGEFLCKFTNYVQGVTIVSCVLTLTAIAVDR